MNVRVLLGLALLLAFAAGAAADDDLIYDHVRHKLYNDPDVKAHKLTITVKDGVVTLEGRVLTEKFKEKAEKLTRKVSGVKDVVNKLTVGEDKPR
jgi:osmotically-inducible protein OsmY